MMTKFFFVRMRLSEMFDESLIFIFVEAHGKGCIQCIET